MLLKSLELQGFKTFPDKTTLTFGEGITAVVGPNGSGKSNISDAIRWVLGEQSPKTLRCSRMEDVVFNGTPTRKAQGFAEVTLTIDNTDRRLPFDGDEVAVTRRFYRSGDSDYLINKASVRLRDIHELFMDTGLGRDGYSIIGQGKIDSIVASRSEDRREIFEEAAGISRFRYRKSEAERRLSQAEENLLRLRDILSELESRVGPLAEQAKKAKDYLEYAGEKRTLEIGLWLNTLEKSGQILREQEDNIAIARSQHEQSEEALEQIRQETEAVFNQINAHAARVDEVRREIASYEEQAAAKQKDISVLENDILHNKENIARVEQEIESANLSSQTMDAQIAGKREAIREHRHSITQKQEELERSTDQMETLQQELSRSAGASEELSRMLSSLTVKASDAKVTAMTSASSIVEIEARRTAVAAELEAKENETSALLATLDDYTAMRKEAAARAEELANAVRGYGMRVDSRRKKQEEARGKADKLTLDAEECIRRARLLEELERNLEGFAQSVKMVMREANRGVLRGILGPVSRIFRVPGEYAVAIETALGAAMQNVVVENEEDAKRAIALLKRKDGGRATFLPVSTIRGNVLNEPGLENCAGFVGIARSLCRCETRYDGVLNSLLGRIAVAKDLDSAVAIAKRFHYRFRVVTLDGQVVNTGGSLTGGSLARNSGLLSRAAEIERIHKEAAQLKEKALAARNEFRAAQQETAAAEAELSGARGELSAAQEERIRIEAECRNTESQLELARKTAAGLKEEQAAIAERLLELSAIQKESETLCEQLALEIAKAESRMNAAAGSREALNARREELTAAMQEIRLQMMAEQKDIESLKTEIAGIQERREDHAGRIQAYHKEIEGYNRRLDEINRQIADLQNEEADLRVKARAAEESIDRMKQDRMELEQRTVLLRQQERDKTAERENIGRDLARMEERKAGLQKEYDEIISRLWEEYELTRREAEEVGVKITDQAAARKRLNELKLKIRNLGTVNVAAIEEYKEVSERYEFMKSQVDDVETSRMELSKLIGELTQQMKELFLARFQQINQNFHETFRELFGGGSCDLSLSNPDDILNSGIDISVQPPGKIVSHLELLSGGEKALVAIALYFSIMKVNPAPFCVLDEIEAALDDVNVDRFAAYLRRMNERTQFIVITHRRGTMEEADVLYGVTMQDEGVSKLLELHTAELEQKLGIK